MNIFYLHHNPYKAATFFYDKHKVKMILECAQMLCTAHHVHDNGDNVPYKKAHLNHPSTIWARSSRSNYYWLYEHMLVSVSNTLNDTVSIILVLKNAEML